MIVAAFSVIDKVIWVRFFEKTFLVVNVNLEVVFRMPFFTLSDGDVNFLGQELRWRTYTTEEAFPTTRCIELVGKKEFATIMLNPENEIYLVHVRSVSFIASPNFSPLELDIYPFYRLQMFGLIAKETLTKIPAEYLDFADIFSLDLTSKLSKHTRINN